MTHQYTITFTVQADSYTEALTHVSGAESIVAVVRSPGSCTCPPDRQEFHHRDDLPYSGESVVTYKCRDCGAMHS